MRALFPCKGGTRVIACVALSILGSGPTAWAIDAYQKVPSERPEQLDLATTVSSTGGYFSATYKIDAACAPLNSIHSWQLALVDRQGEPLSGAQIDISADMPEHLHGMTTRPVVQETTVGGRYRVDGMNFHMPGWWKVVVDASRGRGRDLAYFNILVGEGYCHAESH